MVMPRPQRIHPTRAEAVSWPELEADRDARPGRESGAGRPSGGLLAVGAVGAGLVGLVAVGMLVSTGALSVAGLAQLAAQPSGFRTSRGALLAAGAGRVGHRAAGVAQDPE